MMYGVDVETVGGGLGGSIAAATLGRAGFWVALIDAHHPYPEDFRCEKIEEKQFRLLRETGRLMEGIVAASTLFTELWIARFGRVMNKRPWFDFAAKDGVLNFLRHRLVRCHDRVVNEVVGEGAGIE
ncbi:hypothetical protein EOA85_32440 [Mesorhizobium sp. M5C.F.Ca.IN.020.29.1.1]|uniref:FAD-dependent monooxygenase n=2 Tax=unclassified Mesorhizobium TaxID=325217 RepID=UPI000FCB308B|nr:FAD-dependent monooxygenase [Mesorhizobium sp. M5C.F.Ca.IN.020.29.1.1]RUV49163.1 hypothetical protein EOA85_32440 [Mesorhizobium sp. M5C.F.Ca.IN.020.29.1.1]TIM89701.1 MAG: hypothetical protein E5Y50_04335 [Mesorhizobium sp.]